MQTLQPPIRPAKTFGLLGSEACFSFHAAKTTVFVQLIQRDPDRQHLRFWLPMPAWLSSSNTLAGLRHLSYRVV
jgi:hypothetical protein